MLIHAGFCLESDEYLVLEPKNHIFVFRYWLHICLRYLTNHKISNAIFGNSIFCVSCIGTFMPIRLFYTFKIKLFTYWYIHISLRSYFNLEMFKTDVFISVKGSYFNLETYLDRLQ